MLLSGVYAALQMSMASRRICPPIAICEDNTVQLRHNKAFPLSCHRSCTGASAELIGKDPLDSIFVPQNMGAKLSSIADVRSTNTTLLPYGL